MKELQELRQSINGTSEGSHIVCQHCKSRQTIDDSLSPILSPVSSSSESYFSALEEESASDRLYNSRQDEGGYDDKPQNYTPNVSSLSQSKVSLVAQPDNPDSTWNVEYNPDTKVALDLNPVYTLTQNTTSTYAAFSMDGKYLATLSESGTVHIFVFDVMTGKRIR